MVIGYYGYGNMGDEMLFEVVTDTLRDLGFEVVALYPRSGERPGVRFVKRYDPFAILRELFKSKALVFGGGGIFQDETSFRSMLYYTIVAKLAHLMGKRVILLGSGAGPLRRRMSRILFRWVVKSGKTVVFPRDPITERYVRILGKKTYTGTDLAVLYLRRFSRKEVKVKTAVIVPKKMEDWDDIAEYLKDRGYEVVFLAVSPKETPIVRKYLGRYKVKEGDPVDVISGSSVVLSERFHPCLVASFFGIPFVSIGESKTERFFRKILGDYPGFSSRSKEDIMLRIGMIEGERLEVDQELLKSAEEMIERFKKILINL